MAPDRSVARRASRWVIAAWFAGLLLCVASPATAGNRNMCPTESERTVLTKFGDRIASEGTAAEAQELAMSKLRVGRKGLNRARALLPGESAALAEAEQRLDALEEEVMAGTTPAEVAAPFRRMSSMNGQCEYSTVEIVVIVVGFVLGILPGVIFLFLFC